MALFNLRPASTIQNGDDTSVVPSGTRQGVTADDDNDTYVLFSEQQPPGNQMLLGCGNITALTSGQRVKQYRLRVRDRPEMLVPPATGPATVRVAVELDKWANAVLPATDLRGTQTTNVTRSTGWLRPSNIPAVATATDIIDDAFFNCRLVDHARENDDGDPVAGWRVTELWFDVDVRDRPDVTALALRDGAGVDRCGGTVTDTTRPLVEITGVYGYSGSPGQTVTVTQQWRIFNADQVAATDFEPWVDGPWGPPRHESVVIKSRNQNGVSFTTGEEFGRVDPIENGTWHVYARFGTHDFVDVNGEIWWAAHSSCSWTQNFAVPAAPGVTPTAIDCPPSVELAITAGASTFTGVIRAEIQRAINAGDAWNPDTWTRLVDWTDDPEVPEGGGTDWVDRFVQVSYPEGSSCGTGEAVTYEIQYRVRLYGEVSGAFAYTAWTTTSPVTVDACVVAGLTCPTWVIHPTDADQDWVGTAEVWPWSTSWPFDAAQPVGGGLPSIVSGEPGGRDHAVAFASLSTSSTIELMATLDETQVWLIVADPLLPAIWVAAGASITADPLQIASDVGAIHRVTAPLRQVAQPAATDPPPDLFDDA